MTILARCPHCDNPQDSNSLGNRVARVVAQLEDLAKEAKDSGKAGRFLAVIDRLTRVYELLGKITREIQPANVVQVQVNLLQELGVRSLDEAKRRLTAGADLEAMGDAQQAELAARALGWYLARNPGERAALMALVGQEGAALGAVGPRGVENEIPDAGG